MPDKKIVPIKIRDGLSSMNLQQTLESALSTQTAKPATSEQAGKSSEKK